MDLIPWSRWGQTPVSLPGYPDLALDESVYHQIKIRNFIHFVRPQVALAESSSSYISSDLWWGDMVSRSFSLNERGRWRKANAVRLPGNLGSTVSGLRSSTSWFSTLPDGMSNQAAVGGGHALCFGGLQIRSCQRCRLTFAGLLPSAGRLTKCEVVQLDRKCGLPCRRHREPQLHIALPLRQRSTCPNWGRIMITDDLSLILTVHTTRLIIAG
jgi:hypothetical protein